MTKKDLTFYSSHITIGKRKGILMEGYSGRAEEIALDEGVVGLSRDAFRRKKSLKSLKFPDGLLWIGSCACASTGLKTIKIPAQVSIIGTAPFCYCQYLEEINVSEENEFFCSEEGILYDKSKKTLINYPAGKKQESFSIPEGVEVIGEKAFAGSRYLKRIIVPHSMKRITAKAFCGSYSLEEIEIPEWITSIGRNAFSYCPALKSVKLPDGISVDQYAFWGSDNVQIINPDHLQKSEHKEPEYIDTGYRIKQIEKRDMLEPNQLVVSARLRSDSVLTSEVSHVFSTRCEEREKITPKIESLIEADLTNIDELGIVKLGTLVEPGDILVCKGLLSNPVSLETRLLYAIFGIDYYTDVSLRVPYNVNGEVTDIKIVYRDNKGSTVKDEIESVSVTVLQKFPLNIGDVLQDDSGNEGVVVAFDPNLTRYDMIVNFPFGTKINKKSIAEQSIEFRSVGDYTLLRKIPIATYNDTYVVSGIPQKLDFADMVKFFNYGYGDVLQNVISYQADQPRNRKVLYKNIVHNKPTDVFRLPGSDINEFSCLLKALCLKPIFRDKSGEELSFSYIQENSELNSAYLSDLSLEIDALSDDEIRKMSCGEVTKPDDFNYRTYGAESGGLYCEKIFGPISDYSCRCGKYKGVRYKGGICDKCGVEVTTSEVRYQRFGHLELAVPIQHPFLPNRMLTVLPVLPAELRPAWQNRGRIFCSSPNDLYRRVINRNNRLKKMISSETPTIMLRNEEILLQEEIDGLFNNAYCNKKVFSAFNQLSLSLADRLKNFFTKHLKGVNLDYSAACNVIIDESLSDEQCGLPFRIAFELFKPFLAEKLCKTDIVSNLKEAEKLLERESNIRKINREEAILDLLKSIMQSKKIIVFSKETNGAILTLSPVLTSMEVLTVNFTQYKMLAPRLDEAVTIVFPVSDAAQNMIRDTGKAPKKSLTDTWAKTEGSDMIEELANVAMCDDADIVPLLLKSVQQRKICNFNSECSRYILGKPSEWARDFYKKYSESEEQNVFQDENEFQTEEDDELDIDSVNFEDGETLLLDEFDGEALLLGAFDEDN